MYKSISLLTFAVFFLAGCKKLNVKWLDLKLKPAYIESGDIARSRNDGLGSNPNVEYWKFANGKPFNSSDKALGSLVDQSVTKTNCTPNAFTDKFGNIYAFEGGSIPLQFRNIQKANRLILTANWQSSYTYFLPGDALVCDRNPVFRFRPAGYYLRKVAVIGGVKVYKIRNEEFIEDYTNFQDYHRTAGRDSSNEVNLFVNLGINQAEYDVVTSRPNLVVNGGKIKRALSTPTPRNTIDKITFVPTVPNIPKYQLRVILLKPNDENKAFYNYYERNEASQNNIVNSKLDASKDDLVYNFLNQNFISDFGLGIIRGIECIPCMTYSNYDNKKEYIKILKINEGRPPLPIIDP